MMVFISGGAGFIGSHMAKHLVNHNMFDEIIIYDNFSSGTLNHLKEIKNNINIINGDIKDISLLKKSCIVLASCVSQNLWYLI
jgi:UDP-glucose 4-epimerase